MHTYAHARKHFAGVPIRGRRTLRLHGSRKSDQYIGYEKDMVDALAKHGSQSGVRPQ